MPLFESSIFHGGSIQIVSAAPMCLPNSSRIIHSHGYSLKTAPSG